MGSYLTNGHAWAGYKSADAYVPSYPLSYGGRRDSGIAVVDADGHWIATFRNEEDARRYVAAGVERAKEMEARRQKAHDDSKVDTGDEDRTLCRVCLKYTSMIGIGHHTKAKHGMKLGEMLKLRVPTEREFREFHAAQATGSPA